MVLPSLAGLLAVDITADLGFGEVGLGAAISAFWLVTAVAAPLVGRWVDGRGWVVGARLGACATMFSMIACVLLARSWESFLVVLAFGGIGYAFCSPTSNLLVIEVVPRERQASVLGLKQTAPPLLLAAAGATLPSLALHHGWRWALGCGLLLPIAVLLGAVHRGPGASGPSTSRPGDLEVGPWGTGGRASATCRTGPGLRAGPVVVAAGLGTLSVATVTGFAVFTLVSVGIGPVRAAAVVSVGSLVAVLARVAAGRHLDSRPVEDLTPILLVMAAAALALALVAVGTAVHASGGPGAASTGRGVVLVGVSLGLVAAWTWPALLLLMVVRRSARPGGASGLLQLGSGIGSAVGPVGFGLLSGAGNRSGAWAAMTAATVLAMVLVARGGRVRAGSGRG